MFRSKVIANQSCNLPAILHLNPLFNSDMKLVDMKKPGRPFGGRCWLIDKSLEIINFEFHNDALIRSTYPKEKNS